jgi:hypothetical protein
MQIIADIGAGLIGGYAGTKAMEPIEMKLYEMEPETARKQEEAVRPGSPYEAAVPPRPEDHHSRAGSLASRPW